MKAIFTAIYVIILFQHSPSLAQTRGAIVEHEFFVEDKLKTSLSEFQQMGLVVDHVGPHGYEVYGPKGTAELLKRYPHPFKQIPPEKRFTHDYPSPEEVGEQLKGLAERFPSLMRVKSIGQSHEGRSLWLATLSSEFFRVKPDSPRPLVEFKYVANMHGDEIVGRGLMLRLIEELLKGHQFNPRYQRILNQMRLYIIPSMNPDGAAKRTRGNAHFVDLNRDFPDFTTEDNTNTPFGREPETQALMQWQATKNIVLSANFHGGAVCVNYPWDTSPNKFPLHKFIHTLSVDYASKIPEMRDSQRFPDGVVNGYKWYEVNGGMQDWSYHWHNDLQVTIEVSHSKWPSYAEVDDYYREHRESMLRYIESALKGVGLYSENGSEFTLDLGKRKMESKNGKVYFFPISLRPVPDKIFVSSSFPRRNMVIDLKTLKKGRYTSLKQLVSW